MFGMFGMFGMFELSCRAIAARARQVEGVVAVRDRLHLPPP
jgi:hypothetical protein